jgi:PHD/YefM family antitoxin component YafN of YafNO toxin-antitoxin module
MPTRTIPKTEPGSRIRQELAQLGGDTLLITERGKPLTVAVSVARWNDLQKTFEDLEDCVAILEHRLSQGHGRPAEVVFAAIEAEKASL